MVTSDEHWLDYEPDQIIPHIYLGSHCSGETFIQRGQPAICVHENQEWNHGTHHIPIAEVGETPEGYRDVTGISRHALDAATSLMRHYQTRSVDVVVHCHSGVECGPLTVAWFLKRYQYVKSIPEAYALIQQFRPIAQDRSGWLRLLK